MIRLKNLRLASALALIAFAGAAQAEPYLAAQMGLKCAQCHVNPTGGGMRTVFGNAFAQTQLAAKRIGGDEDMWTGQVMKFLSVGGNARANFNFTDKVTEIKTNTNSPYPLSVLPQSWPYFWRHGQWNELRARIVQNPPSFTTWINGVKIMEWTEKEKRHPDTGGIALQVHGGGDFTKQFVRYRNIRVKKL